jgi:hypothetical protein
MKIGDFIVDFCEFEAIFKKALTRVSGAYGKNQRLKISCQGPFHLKMMWLSNKAQVYLIKLSTFCEEF